MILLGYILCIAGVLLGIASWVSLGWGWGIVAIALFLLGVWIVRRRNRENGDLLGDAIDFAADVVDD